MWGEKSCSCGGWLSAQISSCSLFTWGLWTFTELTCICSIWGDFLKWWTWTKSWTLWNKYGFIYKTQHLSFAKWILCATFSSALLYANVIYLCASQHAITVASIGGKAHHHLLLRETAAVSFQIYDPSLNEPPCYLSWL